MQKKAVKEIPHFDIDSTFLYKWSYPPCPPPQSHTLTCCLLVSALPGETESLVDKEFPDEGVNGGEDGDAIVLVSLSLFCMTGG